MNFIIVMQLMAVSTIYFDRVADINFVRDSVEASIHKISYIDTNFVATKQTLVLYHTDTLKNGLLFDFQKDSVYSIDYSTGYVFADTINDLWDYTAIASSREVDEFRIIPSSIQFGEADSTGWHPLKLIMTNGTDTATLEGKVKGRPLKDIPSGNFAHIKPGDHNANIFMFANIPATSSEMVARVLRIPYIALIRWGFIPLNYELTAIMDGKVVFTLSYRTIKVDFVPSSEFDKEKFIKGDKEAGGNG